jgi:hypothetical protein
MRLRERFVRKPHGRLPASTRRPDPVGDRVGHEVGRVPEELHLLGRIGCERGQCAFEEVADGMVAQVPGHQAHAQASVGVGSVRLRRKGARVPRGVLAIAARFLRHRPGTLVEPVEAE